MEFSAAQRIKHYLERAYDIPFDVTDSKYYLDQCYTIKPHNEDKELFEIKAKFKNQLRLIIEVTPEKYAAFSITDMASSPIEKKKVFSEAARQLKIRRAKIEFFINDQLCDVETPEAWPKEWNSYRLRVTKSPICAEEDQLDEAGIASSWVAIIVGMFLSLLNVTETTNTKFMEGGVKKIEVNRYERNPVNRELCLSSNGYRCKVCNFDFQETYGELGRHFIHVHHIVPISEKETAYIIDPINDLIPVCPNCHAMLHQTTPPLVPEELKSLLAQVKNSDN